MSQVRESLLRSRAYEHYLDKHPGPHTTYTLARTSWKAGQLTPDVAGPYPGGHGHCVRYSHAVCGWDGGMRKQQAFATAACSTFSRLVCVSSSSAAFCSRRVGLPLPSPIAPAISRLGGAASPLSPFPIAGVYV